MFVVAIAISPSEASTSNASAIKVLKDVTLNRAAGAASTACSSNPVRDVGVLRLDIEHGAVRCDAKPYMLSLLFDKRGEVGECRLKAGYVILRRNSVRNVVGPDGHGRAFGTGLQ